MTNKLICTLPHASTSYEISIQPGLIADRSLLGAYLSRYDVRMAILTDDIIAPLYGEELCKNLKAYGLDVSLLSFPAGEQHKTRQTKELLEDRLFAKGLGRDTFIIALGGGVVTDLAGFVAATYCRGIPLIMLPTSLLGMVDASIGGKTGVNTPHGKNMLGAIHQPKIIFIDPTTLTTLPLKELKNGFVEMIKHALIADHTYFQYMEQHADQLLALDMALLEDAISASCRIKKTSWKPMKKNPAGGAC